MKCFLPLEMEQWSICTSKVQTQFVGGQCTTVSNSEIKQNEICFVLRRDFTNFAVAKHRNRKISDYEYLLQMAERIR